MFSLLTKSFAIVAVGFVVPACADDPAPFRTMHVALNWNGDQSRAVIWVSDGTRFSDLSVVANTIEKFGVNDISLFVVARGGELNPMDVSSDQHVGIQLSADRVDLFITNSVPFEFTKTLSENLQQLRGMTEVSLRSTSVNSNTEPRPSATDPFGGASTTYEHPKSKSGALADPFNP